MLIATVRVGLATSRPPKADTFVTVIVSVPIDNDNIASAERDAELMAIAIACAGNPALGIDVQMPVSSQILDIEV